MKKILQWMMLNKGPLFGFFALLLYYLDSLLHITDKMHLSQGWYYGIATLFVVLIGYAIRGKGFQFNIKELVEDIQKLNQDDAIKEQKEEINDIITNETTVTSVPDIKTEEVNKIDKST